MPSVPPPAARERLLASARRLFYGRGINATGIDTVLADAGVAKGSMYHHFDGKQALVLAYLRQELDLWRRRAELLDRPERPAGERVGLLFDALAGSVDDGTFHGCPFTNAVIERPDDPAVGQVVTDYRQAFARHLGALTGPRPRIRSWATSCCSTTAR